MANDTQITVIGNLTADPELRFTQSGVAVASFTIASTPRMFDRQANEWKDGEALFLRCSIWRDAAENVAESLEKGTRVIAQGNLKQRAFTDREGNNRTSIELDVDEIGPSLKYATAKANKKPRGGGNAPRGNPQGEGWGAQNAQQYGSGTGGGAQWPTAAQPGSGYQPAPQQQGFDQPPF